MLQHIHAFKIKKVEIMTEKLWHKVADHDDLADGHVKTVSAGHQPVCLTHHKGEYHAIDNHCPHQGGPLGEGFIDENGYVICPWHGYEYSAVDGAPPPGFEI